MRRLSSPLAVVALWAAMNALMAAMLAGFVGAGLGGSMFVAEVYGGSSALVFLLALLVLLARRRRLQPAERGYRLPRRPAVAVLLAVTGALLWLGLPFGIWVPMLAAVPFTAAVLMEVTARTRG
jgi:uncharacterized protein (TIGR03382 family)